MSEDQQPAPDDSALFEEMVSEGHSMLNLSLTTEGSAQPLTDQETHLVDAAVQAGVLGALSVLRRG